VREEATALRAVEAGGGKRVADALLDPRQGPVRVVELDGQDARAPWWEGDGLEKGDRGCGEALCGAPGGFDDRREGAGVGAAEEGEGDVEGLGCDRAPGWVLGVWERGARVLREIRGHEEAQWFEVWLNGGHRGWDEFVVRLASPRSRKRFSQRSRLARLSSLSFSHEG
jgi:hypothetical protein